MSAEGVSARGQTGCQAVQTAGEADTVSRRDLSGKRTEQQIAIILN